MIDHVERAALMKTVNGATGWKVIYESPEGVVLYTPDGEYRGWHRSSYYGWINTPPMNALPGTENEDSR